jgi:TetR/AcrR family transcriptional regulator, mexJK operon transcriptional repressor
MTIEEPDTRSARKHEAILAAARSVFLHQGYLGASMDEIAARARVSKQTVYRHFTDKERLFIEIVISTVDEVSNPVYAEVLGLRDSGDPQRDLTDLARRQLTGVMVPELLALRRLVIAEAIRFPELGRAFYDRGPGRTMAALAASFARLHDQGRLRCPDPELAARHFNWLVMGEPLNQAMLLGTTNASLDRWAADGVAAFMTAYGGP